MKDDPLRFLKPRKKQFHLTPTKPNKLSTKHHQDIPLNHQKANQQNNHNQLHPSSLLENNHIQKQVFSLKNNLQLQGIISNNTAIKDSSSNTSNTRNYKPTFNSNQYNPQKYFSSAVQNYLRKKRGLQQQQKQVPRAYPQEKVELYSSNTDLSQQEESIQFSKRIQMLKINKQQKIHIEQQNFHNKKVQPNHQSPHNQLQTNRDRRQKQVTNYKLQQQSNILPEYTTQQRKKQVQQISFNQSIDQRPSASFTNKIQPTSYIDDQQEEEKQSDIVELRACPICGRKFNPNSYERHVKVCEKVFVKKRKQFSSEKQRSLSTKKK